jgi:hypothetical protein
MAKPSCPPCPSKYGWLIPAPYELCDCALACPSG